MRSKIATKNNEQRTYWRTNKQHNECVVGHRNLHAAHGREQRQKLSVDHLHNDVTWRSIKIFYDGHVHLRDDRLGDNSRGAVERSANETARDVNRRGAFDKSRFDMGQLPSNTTANRVRDRFRSVRCVTSHRGTETRTKLAVKIWVAKKHAPDEGE